MTRLLGSRQEKPPFNAGRIIGEIIAGTIGGSVLGFLLAAFLNVIGLLLGWIVGSALGVSLVGSTGKETGLFRASLGGSVLGLGVCIIVLRAFVLTWEGVLTVFWFTYVSAVFATIGFNMTRRHRSPPASDGRSVDSIDELEGLILQTRQRGTKDL